ncbi:MAG: GAF domain-containing protein, partial [Chloroflexota bacterium]|nr:GAF domain-containing protein [Chloroflexota bacterium]
MADRWAVLNAVLQEMGESPHLESALQRLLDRVLEEVLGLEAGWLVLRDGTTEVFHVVATSGVSPEALTNWQAVDSTAEQGHLATRMDGPVLADDLSLYPELAHLTAQDLRCYVGLPLLACGRPQGFLAALGHGSCPFDAEDRDVLIALGQQIGMAVESLRLHLALEQSQQRCRMLSEVSRDAIFLMDGEAHISFANQRASALTGYSLAELVNMDVRHLLTAESYDEIIATLDRHLADESSPVSYEAKLITKSGEHREVEFAYTRACKELLAGVVSCAYVRDVTERKRVGRLLQSLSSTALAVQRAHNPQDVFEILGRKLEEEGIKAIIAALDEDGRRLILKHLNLEPAHRADLRRLLGKASEGESFPLDAVSTFQRAVSGAQTIFVSSLQIADGLPPHIAGTFAEDRGICAPLIIGDQVYGILALAAPFLTEADVRSLTIFAHYVVIALENAQYYQTAIRRAQELATLNEIGRAVGSTLDLDSLLEHTMEGINRVLNVEAGSVLLVDEETGDLVFRISLQHDEWQKISGLRVPAGTGVVGAVVQEGKPYIVPDVTQEARFYQEVDEKMDFDTSSILCVPLISRGQTIGAIEVLNKIGGPFTTEDLELLSSISASVGVAIENVTLYKAEQAHAE